MAFASLGQLGAAALLIANDPFFNSRSDKLAELTIRFRIPAIYQYRQFVEVGGLMSYGASNTEFSPATRELRRPYSRWREAGGFAGRTVDPA